MKSKVVITLSVIAFILLLIDIIVHLWFGNKYHLRFDPINFNNIGTPLIGVISLIVYGVALAISFKQNKIILSQSLRPYYEKQIDKIGSDLVKIEYKLLYDNGKTFNGLTYPELIRYISDNMYQEYSKEIYEDLDNYKSGIREDMAYFKTRSYINEMHKLWNIIYDYPTIRCYDEIQFLINDIKQSNLTEDDKIQLRKRIKDDLVKNYILYISSEKTRSMAGFYQKQLPIIWEVENYKTPFKRLFETQLGKYYDYFIKELNIELG